MGFEHVEAKRAPKPAGPYSAAVWAGDFILEGFPRE